MSAEPTPVVDCTKCGIDLSKRDRPLCQGCVDDACEAVIVDCTICGKQQATHCGDCAQADLSYVARDWATRRKALGLLSAECFEAFELFVSDLEAGEA